LKNINLKIPYNSVVGLVGASGGGKTTVLNLILGLYTNYEGLIKVMGKELREWSLDELRQNISASLREDYFFSDTIYNNIQIANPKISMEEIEKEFIAANAYDFIMKTNLQLDTLIGSGGIGLSGGEMQRLSFARALMKKSKLLILDEPTSALDKKSEEIIRRSIYDRKNEQTIVIISHRLDILKEADIIYVLEDGKIVEMGTYQKIVENKKLYKKLYKQEFYETVGKL
ncbi:ATP-binding cassette domain-containing protein, partial [Blautia pseudococcoides]|nr:ATP-binding cassette domain-containing protein [Blautia pseudococcoides]